MGIKRNNILPLLLVTALLLTGCAKIVSPTGGPKDVTPPSITKESPQNGCNNFKGNTIKISFSELYRTLLQKFLFHAYIYRGTDQQQCFYK